MVREAGKSLRAWRQANGLTVFQLGERLGIHGSHVSRIERGLVETLDVATALRIREVAGIPVESWDRGQVA